MQVIGHLSFHEDSARVSFYDEEFILFSPIKFPSIKNTHFKSSTAIEMARERAYCNHWTGLDWTGLDWTGLSQYFNLSHFFSLFFYA